MSQYPCNRLMSKFPHLIRTGPLSVAFDDFEPFPLISNDEWLGRLLDPIAVNGVTAIWHHCLPRWAMKERRMGDDMLFYITNGSGTAWVEGRKFELRPGMCAHFPRGRRHAAEHNPKNPIHVISVHYTATVFESLTLPELLRFPDSFDLRGDRRLDTMFQAACREYALRPPGYERGLEALILRILLRLIRDHGRGMALDAQEMKVADLRRLLPALETIRKSLGRPIFIGELARAAGFSEAQFRRVFQRAMSVSPVQYLRRVRMEHACHLLRRTDQTVDAIAAEVGYAEPAFFAHSFKKLVGVTPGKYRSAREL